MPPRSYVIIAIVLAALVAGGFPDRLGFSVSVWYAVFDVVLCLLVVPGAFQNCPRAPNPSLGWDSLGFARIGLRRPRSLQADA